ncbi:MAG: SDR family NAD(P)-dependent oxidoreductase [Candidatus Dormiibacterota bacterium]
MLVTGASGGLGRAIASAFADGGARVALGGRDRDRLTTLARELEARSGAGSRAGSGEERCRTVLLDVADGDACAAAVAEVERAWGGLDVLVNNAGIATSEPFLRLDDATWERALAVNAGGPFRLTRAALPGMLARGWGRVIQIASTAALAGQARVAAYAASKHALLGLTRSLAVEYAASGVTFNCVCPHFVAGSLTERTVAAIMERTGRSEEAARAPLQTPQGRLVQPEEVAAACLYLARDVAAAVNGQAIALDGALRGS